MYRKKLIAGNWKMNGLLSEGHKLAVDVMHAVNEAKPKADVLICPPFTLLSSVCKSSRRSSVMIGAQDCSKFDAGAHTGDISPVMLKDVGCKYVILGHSERRIDHKESNTTVRAKATAALHAGLKVIICVGETLKEREAGRALDVVEKQVKTSLPSQTTAANTVIAYEPVWAIGTGKTATPEDAEEVHAHIRKVLVQKYGKRLASHIKILYGGSMKPANAAELLAKPDIDGGLIGGASLKAEDFVAIINKAK